MLDREESIEQAYFFRTLRERLPEIPIPLKHDDADATVDLQAITGGVYDAAGYEDYIYRGTPQPPLHPEDAAWAKGLIC